VWGDHQTADPPVCRVPLLIRRPGLTDGGRVDNALHYHFDWTATLIELAGGSVPGNWDGVPFTGAFKSQSRERALRFVIFCSDSGFTISDHPQAIGIAWRSFRANITIRCFKVERGDIVNDEIFSPGRTQKARDG